MYIYIYIYLYLYVYIYIYIYKYVCMYRILRQHHHCIPRHELDSVPHTTDPAVYRYRATELCGTILLTFPDQGNSPRGWHSRRTRMALCYRLKLCLDRDLDITMLFESSVLPKTTFSSEINV